MAAGPVFPGFIRVEYETKPSSKAKFLADAAQLSGEIKKPFSEAFDQIGKMVDRVSGKLKDGYFSLDLDTSSLRAASAQADFTAKKLGALRDAALQIATANKDQSESTLAFTKALQAQAAEAERVSQTARDQLTAYTNLQGAVSSLTRENQALAQSYRDTFLEQAKVANAAYKAQQQFNALAGVKRPEDAASRNGAPAGASQSAFAEQGGLTSRANQGYTDTRNFVEKYIQGRQALEGMAQVSGTLETVLGRVANKGKDVAAALKEAAAAAQKAANVDTGPRRANPGPTNTRSGVDALVAGQASLDRAAISGTTLEQVLGRVANRGREVGAALAEAERAAAKATQERVAAQAKAEAEATAAKERASAELQRLGQAAEELNARLNPAVGIQQRYNNEIEQARKLLQSGVIDQRLYAQAVQAATREQTAALAALNAQQEEHTKAQKRGTSETSNVINGIRAQRVAFTQLGQQLQDVVVQTQMGTNATTIFVQQVPQMAFALSGLSESTNKTQARIGQFATFLAGPWGAAIFAATAVLAPFIARLFQSGDAAKHSAKALDQVAFASSAVSSAQGILGGVMDITTGKINTQSAALIALARAQIAVAQIESRERQAKAGEQIADFTQKYGPNYNAAAARGLVQQDRPLSRLQEDLRTGKKTADEVVKSLEGMVATGQLSQGMFIDLAKAYANFGVEAENQKVFDDARKLLDGKGGTNLLKPKKERDRTKELQRLAEFGEDAGKKIANIRDSFADIPPEVERVNKASRELDDIISDLMNRKPEGFAELVDQAKALKEALPDMAFARVMREITADAQQQVQYQMLMLQGREGEAQALQQIYQIEQNLGPLRKDQKEQIIATHVAMQRVNEQMQRASEIQSVFLDATRNVRSEVEAILGGYGSIGDLGKTLRRSFQQIQGKILTERIFGDVFRDMDRYVKEKTGIGSSVDLLKSETERAGEAAGKMADELLGAAMRISNSEIAGISGTSPAVGNSIMATGKSDFPTFEEMLRGGWSPPIYNNAANDNYDPNAPITVEGRKPGATRRVIDLTPEEFFRKMGQDVGAKWAALLEPLLGKKLAGNLGGVLGGVLEGQATTGTGFGAILGGLKELKGLPAGLSKLFGKAFEGAQTGAAVAGISNALGLKMSNTGAQIGGAIGSALPIPGGQIIGAIAGGLLGKLFSGTKKGYAVANNGNVTTGGNRTQADNAAAGANSLNDSLSTIARAFGTSLGNYAVSIGSRSSGYIRVSASGSTRVGDKSFAKNGGSDLLYDGKDMQEALRIALKNAIEDGAIQGIKAGSKRLLSIGNNIDAQVEKALKFEKVFKDLRQIKDPVGFALEELNTEFKGLIDIFKEAGASAQELADLEELYGIKRKDAIKQASEAMLGPIQSLLESLTIGSDFYSLRDRQASAQAIYNPLAARVQAGDMTAYAEFSDAAQALIDINRQIYGSTSPFFDFVDSVKAISQGAVDREQAKIDAATASDSPFTQLASQQQATVSAIDSQTEALIAALGGRLDNINANLIASLRASAANGNTVDYGAIYAARGYW